ncbi:Rad9-domain-containing protein [Xylariomycetidae sp. FL2044]|nr:Rad9-domain-containing protein [Xylariomycetidae sp. FL2044]
MAVLKFTLSEEGVSVLREALVCLVKFNDEVTLEAKQERLTFTTLNLSKSAYASFALQSNRFFSKYIYEGQAQHRERFFCKLYGKALISLFRNRGGDPLHDREKDTTIDKCDVSIVDEPGKKSRFIAKIVFRNGITTKYQLPFEISPPIHAKFDKDQATNHWSMPSRSLRQMMDHFGPGIDYLDIHSDEDEVVNFTCFTEKVTQGDEVLKKPLHTSIAVERDEFEKFDVEDNIHIVISVKDFRAIVLHASAIGRDVSAHYSSPAKPMQLAYNGDGLKCQFLLMTVGERSGPAQKAKKGRANTGARRTAQLDAAAESRATSRAPTVAPPHQPSPPALPSQPQPRADPMPSLRPPMIRPSQRPPPPTLEDESLFVPQDNDEAWEPVDANEDDEEDTPLGWDASDLNPLSNMDLRSMIASRRAGESRVQDPPEDGGFQVEPTQRLSQVRKFGMFDM